MSDSQTAEERYGDTKATKEIVGKTFFDCILLFWAADVRSRQSSNRKQTITAIATATKIALIQHLQRAKDCGKQIC